jgi:spoIIIJ-associated protein
MQDQEVNSNEIVEEGKPVEEAIEKGLERLGLTRDQVDIEVLEEGTKGVLSLIGVKQAKVLVRKKDDSTEITAKIEELASTVMKLMGISSQIRTNAENDVYKVEIETAGVDGLLIGKKGQNLEALTHLLRRMVGKQLKRSVRMEVDVGGYKDRRDSSLRSKAVSMASRAKASGKEMQVEPLAAAERRIIHLALADDPEIRTYTVGDGELKSVVIAPARRGARPTVMEERQVE